MLVRMKTHIGGYRDGAEWPDVGGTIDVPDHEAADLVRNYYAEVVSGAEPDEQPTEDPGDSPGADGSPVTGADPGEPEVVPAEPADEPEERHHVLTDVKPRRTSRK